MLKNVFSSDVTKLNGSLELILGYSYVSVEFHMVVVLCLTDLQQHQLSKKFMSYIIWDVYKGLKHNKAHVFNFPIVIIWQFCWNICYGCASAFSYLPAIPCTP